MTDLPIRNTLKGGLTFQFIQSSGHYVIINHHILDCKKNVGGHIHILQFFRLVFTLLAIYGKSLSECCLIR